MRIHIEYLTETIINFHIYVLQYKCVSGLQLHLYIKDNEAHISNLFTNTSFRSKGFASILISKVCDFLEKKYKNINIITLSDESTYYRNPKSIYLKWNFKYDDKNKRLMTGYIKEIPRISF
jgi:hypothetical protein